LPTTTTLQQRSASTTISQPEPKALPIDTSDWNTYRNEQFGIEAKYPSSWFKYYEATNKDILGQINTNRRYELDRSIELVGWQDVPLGRPYAGIGYISFSLHSKAPTDQFIAEQMRSLNYKTVKGEHYPILTARGSGPTTVVG
jgi:hypothetical protein